MTSTTVEFTTTFTSTVTSTVTSTSSLPGEEEICGNCLDDDGNGLTDYDDPACCDGGTSGVMIVNRLRLRARDTDSKLGVFARLDGLVVDDLSGGNHGIDLQLADDPDAPFFCASFAPETLRASSRTLRFRDKHGEVAAARGIASLRLRRKPSGRVKLRIGGKHVRFLVGDVPQLRVTVAVHETTGAQTQTRCLSAVEALRTTKGGGLRFP